MALVRENGDTVATSLSDNRGFFSLAAPEPGTYRVLAQALGYIVRGEGPFDLGEGGLIVTEVQLEPAPIAIEGLDVTTTPLRITDDALLANGFYRRMMEGRGQFLTPEDIGASTARFTPHLFRGLKYIQPQYGAAPWQTWVQFWSPAGRGSCTPRVWVDNVWVNRPGWEQFNPGTGMEDVVRRDDIKAIEVYWGMQAPLKYDGPDAYGGNAFCGVVLIWTTSGI